MDSGALLSTLALAALLGLAGYFALRGHFWFAVLAAAAATLFVRLPQAPVPIYNIDEAINAAIAQRLQEGAVLYDTALDHKPPLSFVLYRVVFDLFGPWNMTAVHIVGALLHATALVLVALLGCRLLPPPLAPWPAIVLAPYGVLYFRYDFLALNHELGGLPFFLGAALAFWRGLDAGDSALAGRATGRWRSRRRLWFFAAGVLGMTAGLFREACAMIVPVCAAFLVLRPWIARRSRPRELPLRKLAERPAGPLRFGEPVDASVGSAAGETGGVWGDLAALGAGVAVPLGAFLGWILAHGLADDAWRLMLVHNFPYVAAGRKGARYLVEAVSTLRTFLQYAPAFWVVALVSLGALFGGVVRAAATRRALAPERLFLALWCAAALFMAGQGGRFHGHYFLPFYPPLALAIGVVLAGWGPFPARWFPRRAAGADPPLGPHGLGVAVAAVMVALSLWPYYRYQAYDQARCLQRFVLGDERARTRVDDIMITPKHLAVLPVLEAMTTPEESIFVWGFSPQFYVLAPRRAATRFPFVSLITGVTVEGKRIETDPGLWTLLRSDLEAERPALVLDASSLFIKDRPLEEFPEFRSWLLRRYRPVIEVAGCRIYERNDRKPTEVVPAERPRAR